MSNNIPSWQIATQFTTKPDFPFSPTSLRDFYRCLLSARYADGETINGADSRLLCLQQPLMKGNRATSNLKCNTFQN